MDKKSLYTSGQFAKKAHVSTRTIRYYDQQNILKPTMVTDNGTRLYSDSDFTHLQQVLLLKYLGFSLDEIRNLTIGDSDSHILLNSLEMQQKLVKDRIAQLQLVDKAITDTTKALRTNNAIDWSRLLDLIHLTNMESSLKTQYINSSNISARIKLHALYSTNSQGWFPWVFEQLNLSDNNDKVLELGCGDGSLWAMNYNLIPPGLSITLSDLSSGMLRDAKRKLDSCKSKSNESAYAKAINPKPNLDFHFKTIDCSNIPYDDDTFDVIIANHVLFYCDNLEQVLSEIRRVLKPSGTFICSTYGKKHMQEINQLVQRFDERITLSKDHLYEHFGLDNGSTILKKYFNIVETHLYNDSLIVDRPEPIIDYILSCHGNQNQYLLNRYSDFKSFMNEQLHIKNGALTISKDAGLFCCFIN